MQDILHPTPFPSSPSHQHQDVTLSMPELWHSLQSNGMDLIASPQLAKSSSAVTKAVVAFNSSGGACNTDNMVPKRSSLNTNS